VLGMLLFVLPWLAEHGHSHADHAQPGDTCQACQFWNTHLATGTPPLPQLDNLPSPTRISLPVHEAPPQTALLLVHSPRGPPACS
jgi:hypothetical protein